MSNTGIRVYSYKLKATNTSKEKALKRISSSFHMAQLAFKAHQLSKRCCPWRQEEQASPLWMIAEFLLAVLVKYVTFHLF